MEQLMLLVVSGRFLLVVMSDSYGRDCVTVMASSDE